jgi:lipopolysaccharide/colanic/teichoic acid biosynthesis glycosyltransferase
MCNKTIKVEETAYLSTLLGFFEKKAIRIMDLSIALPSLIVSFPIMLVIAIIIKMDSPGPAIFRQVRIGKNRRHGNNGNKFINVRKEDLGGKPFVFYKFRTMHADAREKFPELYRYEYSIEEAENLYFKDSFDPRHTRLGEKLRKTTVDELPNFINVIRGEMSMVGPRPDIPEMVKYYKNWQKKKFCIKPGITGLAQIHGRGLLSFQETLKYDVEMVNKHSLWFNTKIMLITFGKVFYKRGAF